MPNFYDECMKKLFDFVYQEKDLNEEEIYTCLRNVIGHEPCELLKSPKNGVSLTDVRTDLKYLFDEIAKRSVPRTV